MIAVFAPSTHQSIFLASSDSTMKVACGRGLKGFGNPCQNGSVVSTFDAVDSPDDSSLRPRDSSEVGLVKLEGNHDDGLVGWVILVKSCNMCLVLGKREAGEVGEEKEVREKKF